MDAKAKQRYRELRRELVLGAVDTTPPPCPHQNPNPPAAAPPVADERAGAAARAERRRRRRQKEAALHCPRCNSDNTKFCYYNNHSLTQPRYFCETCRRYWTEGEGSLRDVPVGGGCRKNRRRSPAAAAAAVPSSGAAPNGGVESGGGCGTGATVAAGGGAVRVLSAMEVLRSTGCYVPLLPQGVA